jgi:hypothetical protein
MRLDDPSPRPVAVRFEDSPPDQPGRLATFFTPSLPAWLEPGPEPGTVRVTVPGRAVEQRFLRDQRTRPGSFSDFVWIFEAASGAVLSARLRGTLVRHLELGPIAGDVDTPFATDLTTSRVAGFEPGRRVFGQLVFPFCRTASDGCTIVRPRRYDPATGYVNAVGPLLATALGVSAQAFSPLGEAIFTEQEQRPADLAAMH